MKLILASESPTRKRALDILGLTYETRPSAIDEKAIRDPDPGALTQKLAQAKALKIAQEVPNALVVAGDAVVAKNGTIFEKPSDLDEARHYLSELSGNTFQFITSVVVLDSTSRKMLSAVETSHLTFRQLVDREIDDYIRRYPVLKFAGAFEGDAVVRFSEHVSGCFNFVTGLPASRLAVLLREFGVET
jgi:septum formation protein